MKFVTLDSERSEFLVGNLDPLCVGEERYQLTGMIEQRLFVVVYTPRHNAMRIISGRKANRREVKRYEDSTHDD